MDNPYVIIIANGLNGLGAVRSASVAGLRTYTLLTNQNDLSAFSRFAQYRFILPASPTLEDVRPILDQLRENEGGPGVLLACSDLGAELLGQLKSEGYDRHHLIVPDSRTTDILNDKKLECEAMEAGGITLPATCYDLASDDFQHFPMIIKPRTFREYQVLGAKNRIVDSPEELDAFRKEFPRQLDRFIGQEVIAGADTNLWVCNVTFDRNQELATCFVFNRLGTMPSHYGVTSLAISRANEALVEECRKIGKALGYTGPAMIEFKKDANSDRYFYIETNPRLGMCNWFDTRCGVNNILASARVAYGEDAHVAPQKNNRVYWNFFGDLIARLEDRERLFSILALYLGLLRYQRVGALLYWRDLRPALRYSWTSLRDLVRRTRRKLSERLS